MGSRFYISSDYSENKFTPFIGFLFGAEYGEGIILIPTGLNCISKKGFNVSLSLNEMIFIKETWQSAFVELVFEWKF